MNIKAIAVVCCLSALAAGSAGAATGSGAGTDTVNNRKLAQITPGKSTKAQVSALLGTPWRIVQFNDCGEAMPGQSDETWDYRGRDAGGTFRVHIEFDGGGVAHLIAKIPDSVTGDKGTTATIAPSETMASMRM
jgi:outer membrane protein assembly factor BamE (lipoprotein component of BamABCDE complex)